MEKLEEAIVDKKVFGKGKANINKYLKQIVSQVFPVLENKYEIKMAPDPISQRPNSATFTGKDFKGNKVMIDFNSNHSDLEDGYQVFSNVFYGLRGAKAGSYDITKPEETADALALTLKEIGYKTRDELTAEEQNAEKAKEEARAAEEAKQKKAREKYQQDRDNIEYNKNLDKEETTSEPEAEEEPERTFSEVLKDSVVELQDRGQRNSSIHIAFRGEKDFSVDCYYAAFDKFLVQSEDLSLNKLMRVDEMVNYLNDLSQKYKVTSCNTYEAPDPNNKDAERGISVNLF